MGRERRKFGKFLFPLSLSIFFEGVLCFYRDGPFIDFYLVMKAQMTQITSYGVGWERKIVRVWPNVKVCQTIEINDFKQK